MRTHTGFTIMISLFAHSENIVDTFLSSLFMEIVLKADTFISHQCCTGICRVEALQHIRGFRMIIFILSEDIE